MQNEYIEAVAHHEAGHVAALYFLGYLDDLETVTIVPDVDDIEKGACVLRPETRLLSQHCFELWRGANASDYRRMLEHSIIFRLSGRASEARFLNTDVENVTECGADISEVEEYVGHYSDELGVDSTDILLDEFNQQAIALFEPSPLWSFVESVSQSLVKKRSLTGNEVRTIAKQIFRT
jgi:ATP-dependent Zn protease